MDADKHLRIEGTRGRQTRGHRGARLRHQHGSALALEVRYELFSDRVVDIRFVLARIEALRARVVSAVSRIHDHPRARKAARGIVKAQVQAVALIIRPVSDEPASLFKRQHQI